jgi:SAM-dependent methyltransferase
VNYGTEYFEWQKGIGEFGAEADFFKIEDLLTDAVKSILEFGCGGGFWLARLKAYRVLGVEVNDVARESCSRLGVPVVAGLMEVDDDSFDLCFSHHVLEHVADPLASLKGMREKLRKDGTVRIITPFDTDETFHRDDVNHHLFTWSAQNMGNLLVEAGYRDVKAEYLHHAWPNDYMKEYGRGRESFNKLAVKKARRANIRQVVATGKK